MLPWYKSYFEFAVQTGLRPSEQVALKWTAIDGGYIHIELSRVRKLEKTDLKTEHSVRRIELRPNPTSCFFLTLSGKMAYFQSRHLMISIGYVSRWCM
jgi:integrase